MIASERSRKGSGAPFGALQAGSEPRAAATLQGLSLCLPSRGTAGSRGTRTAPGASDAWPGCSASSPSCWGPSSSCSTSPSASEVTLPPLPPAQLQQEPQLAPSSSPGDGIDLSQIHPHPIPSLSAVTPGWLGHHQLHSHRKNSSENGLLPAETHTAQATGMESPPCAVQSALVTTQGLPGERSCPGKAWAGFERVECCTNRRVSGHKSTCPEIQPQNVLGTSQTQPHLPNQHDQHSSGKQKPQKHPKAKAGV